jgi:hypothetical protein
MRESFFGYYRPTDAEYETLWKDALIVFDANALLNFYRVPPKGREALFKTLEYFADRLWIPHQAGIEFHRNRFDVVRKQNKLTTDALTKTSALIQDLKNSLNEIKIDQHDIGFDPSSALEKLATPLEEISAGIRRVQETEINLISSDPVRDRLDAIFCEKIGPAPKTQEKLDELCRDVAHRYQSKIPPGWKDAETKKDQSFYSDHLHYQNANGDLIFWRQLIEHAKSESVKNVILVTNENKEDWWWKESGETVGPLPELMREIRREAGVELFWMYKTDLFLKTSQGYTSGDFKVTPEAVDEVREVVERENLETKALETYQRRLSDYRSSQDEEPSGSRLFKIWMQNNKHFAAQPKNKKWGYHLFSDLPDKDTAYTNPERKRRKMTSGDLSVLVDAEKWLTEHRGHVIDRSNYGDFTVLVGVKVCQYRLDYVENFEDGLDLIAYIRSEILRSQETNRPAASRFIFFTEPENLVSANFTELTSMLETIVSTFELEEITLVVRSDEGFQAIWSA